MSYGWEGLSGKMLHKIGLGHAFFFFFLDQCLNERAQPTVGRATPRYVALGSIRKQIKEVMRNKPVSSVPPWFLLQLPPLGSCPA